MLVMYKIGIQFGCFSQSKWLKSALFGEENYQIEVVQLKKPLHKKNRLIPEWTIKL